MTELASTRTARASADLSDIAVRVLGLAKARMIAWKALALSKLASAASEPGDTVDRDEQRAITE